MRPQGDDRSRCPGSQRKEDFCLASGLLRNLGPGVCKSVGEAPTDRRWVQERKSSTRAEVRREVKVLEDRLVLPSTSIQLDSYSQGPIISHVTPGRTQSCQCGCMLGIYKGELIYNVTFTQMLINRRKDSGCIIATCYHCLLELQHSPEASAKRSIRGAGVMDPAGYEII